jgi:transcriptional regulator with XRE-family HTH domain
MSYGVQVRNTSSPIRGNWAAYVRALRDRTPVSNVEFARRAGVDRGTVDRWMNGKTRPNDPEVLERFARGFELDSDEVAAAAGLRPGAEAPSEPTVERDEELELILTADLPQAAKQELIETLLRQRDQDKARRMENLRLIIGGRRGA